MLLESKNLYKWFFYLEGPQKIHQIDLLLGISSINGYYDPFNLKKLLLRWH